MRSHRSDDGGAESRNNVGGLLEGVEVHLRPGRLRLVGEGQVEEEIGEPEPVAVGNALEAGYRFRRVVAQHVDRPSGQFKAKTTSAREPPQRVLEGRIPVECPNGGAEKISARGHAAILPGEWSL